MTAPVIPKSSHALVVGSQIDARWHEFFRRLATSAVTSAQVQAMVDAAVDALGDDAIRVLGLAGIDVTGNAEDGYFVALRALEDSGEGAALVKITRDSYGRVSGTEASTAADLPYVNTTSGLTADEVQAALDELSAEKLDDAPSDGTSYVRKDGAWTAETGGGSGGNTDPREAIIDPGYDMLWKPPTDVTDATSASYPWSLSLSGAGTVTQVAAGAGSPGVWQLAAGPGTTDRVGITQGRVANHSVGGGGLVIPFRFRIPTLSDGTNTFTVAIGFADNFATATNRIYLLYAHSANGGALRLITQSAGTTTITNGTGASLVANTWLSGRIEINAAGTQADLYEGATLTATTALNIPTAAMLLGAFITKSAGGSTRALDIDYLGPAQVTFTTPR